MAHIGESSQIVYERVGRPEGAKRSMGLILSVKELPASL